MNIKAAVGVVKRKHKKVKLECIMAYVKIMLKLSVFGVR
jgi:hypothetical protein